MMPMPRRKFAVFEQIKEYPLVAAITDAFLVVVADQEHFLAPTARAQAFTIS